MRNTAVTVLALITTAGLSLTACSNEGTNEQATAASQSASAENNGAFPVTIDHAFGSTTVKSAPQRVATVAWANHEVPLALGITPVGMEKVTWGDDDSDGIMPWVSEKLNGEQPQLFDATDSIPFESIADSRPDVILAAYSGMTKEDYEQLSKIAPTIAYPTEPWATSWEETITMNARALGKASEGEQLVKDLKKIRSDAFAKHPELKGKKVMFSNIDPSDLSSVSFYTMGDPRMNSLVEVGMSAPKVVEDADPKQFFKQVSSEKPEAFDDVDLIVTYGTNDQKENAKLLKQLQQDPLLSKVPAIAAGHVVFLGEGPKAAVSNPSPLNIPWGSEEYFATLAKGLS